MIAKGSKRPWCGGTLISDTYVLTAGHCVERKHRRNIQLVLGDHDWTKPDETDTFKVDVLDIKIHPNFRQKARFDNDFALLRLKHPVDFSSYPGIRPACMPERYNFVGMY